MDEIQVLTDSMIDEVDGDMERALSAATCVRNTMHSVVEELKQRMGHSDE